MHFSRLVASAPLALAATIHHHNNGGSDGQRFLFGGGRGHDDFTCDLPSALDPSDDGLPSATSLFTSKEALARQIERHSALVRVPTICYDDLGPFDTDPRWAPYHEFHDVLAKTFPLVHQRFTRQKINTFGLLYTLPGSDPSLKPLMLAAHQDVVPVADASTWTHPPFDAYFDGTWLWGRGASDDKNSLTALLSAVETLLAQPGFQPRRTVLLAFGFDEECSGAKGAGHIATHLRDTLGEDSLAIVLDEGGMGLQQIGDVLYALPAVMEKGHVDIWFSLHLQGGHSSTPFPHTGIGIVSEMVVALESNPYRPELIRNSPIYNHYVCQARYSPDAEPEVTKLLHDGDLETLAEELASQDRSTHYRLQTSQAVDYIGGGQKINAMPEVVTLGVNYRVAPQDHIGKIMHNVVKYITPVANKYGVTLKPFEKDDEYAAYVQEAGAEHDLWAMKGGAGAGEVDVLYDVDYNATLVLSASQKTQAAPVSPSNDDDVWDVFSGTIQHSFAFDGGKVVPVGELMTGNTDTRHYLDFTRHVYRWSPTRQGGSDNIHTIDERVNMTVHMELVRFYYDFVRNFDAANVAKIDNSELEL
ncbi:carboxypeptidase S [Cryphonectria parasitica EP155]|uniref:Carboxypeptidase S n=1 Tax=Cryphonectria parasitica (strain ATCC 38755 / EP155) TaxID=660469 RepID=A0A9P4XVP2_CRYP1|nr:carboxypeptidase S [Cryphonectria parasitica EP155]KAF3761652.1 carboxypeptidase S [Cryphonectria parasitica EP155]